MCWFCLCFQHGSSEGSLQPQGMNEWWMYIYNKENEWWKNINYRLWSSLCGEMFKDTVQETMFVLLPEVLCQVFVCSSWNLWQQGGMPLLQQLEDQKGRTQMPLNLQTLTILHFFPSILKPSHLYTQPMYFNPYCKWTFKSYKKYQNTRKTCNFIYTCNTFESWIS